MAGTTGRRRKQGGNGACEGSVFDVVPGPQEAEVITWVPNPEWEADLDAAPVRIRGKALVTPAEVEHVQGRPYCRTVQMSGERARELRVRRGTLLVTGRELDRVRKARIVRKAVRMRYLEVTGLLWREDEDTLELNFETCRVPTAAMLARAEYESAREEQEREEAS